MLTCRTDAAIFMLIPTRHLRNNAQFSVSAYETAMKHIKDTQRATRKPCSSEGENTNITGCSQLVCAVTFMTEADV